MHAGPGLFKGLRIEESSLLTFAHGNPKMQLDQQRTALVLADIQDDCLVDIRNGHPMIEDKLKENCVVDHLEQLLQCASQHDFQVSHSAHSAAPR